MLKFIGKNPLCWNVTYNTLGWTVSHFQSNASVSITEKQAMFLIKIISRAHIAPYFVIP